jgi:hypothetical protein
MVPREWPHQGSTLAETVPIQGSSKVQAEQRRGSELTRVATWAIAEHIKGDYVTCVT